MSDVGTGIFAKGRVVQPSKVPQRKIPNHLPTRTINTKQT